MNEFKAQEEEQDRETARNNITFSTDKKNVILRHSKANDRGIFLLVSGKEDRFQLEK